VGFNAVLRAKAQHYGSMVLADWDAYSRDHPEWMTADGVHVNATGAFALANFIVGQIDQHTPSRCGGAQAGDPSAAPVSGPTRAGPAGRLRPSAPRRMVDTRPGAQSPLHGALVAGVPVAVKLAGTAGVPTGATAVSFNLTAVLPAADVYVAAYPCAAAAPLVSNINAPAGAIVANRVVAD